ncbi:MAG: glycosyltransferase family 1 protein [Proteiniphilum sp.]
MTKAMFLSFSGYSVHSGISKKKLAQIKGLEECGCQVVNCHYTVDPTNGNGLWMTDDRILLDLGKGIIAKIRKRIDYHFIYRYVKKEQVSFVYMRSEHNANPFLIHFIKKLKALNISVVMEIPTFPYDHEYITFKGRCSLFIDRLFRKKLAKQLNAIVTFSNYEQIFGKRTVQISNGIDFSTIQLKESNHKKGELHLIGVAEIHYWHGFDRVVAGIRNYYSSKIDGTIVYFHIVGEFSGGREREEIVPLISNNQLGDYIILHGPLYGEELDRLFDHADIGIGSLARHRNKITYIKTLKNREYAARGIPFIYSEIDKDFEGKNYVLKVPADDSSVNVHQLIDFYNSVPETPEEIRNSVKHLSWKNQMRHVLNLIPC